MKKLFYFAAAAVALAACAKNEVIPVNSGENQEITFNVAPKTKADPQTEAFSTDNVFASWAYYLPKGAGTNPNNWADNWNVRSVAKEYISNSTIMHMDGVWKNNATSYYWPKDGKLTFFAYSLNRGDLTLIHNGGASYPIECHNAENAYGINATIDLTENQNLDLLVAEIATNKTENETFHNINGVPTLFKHKFSRVQFAVRKKDNCKDASITLKSIKFNNVAYAGHYSQYNKNSEGSFIKDYCKETDAKTSLGYTSDAFEVESVTDFVPITKTSEINYIYMPQNFKKVTEESQIATIEIKYTVQFRDGISEDFTRFLKVKDIFESWDVGKKYTFNLIFSLNEITWAPAVQDWEDGTTAADQIVA